MTAISDGPETNVSPDLCAPFLFVLSDDFPNSAPRAGNGSLSMDKSRRRKSAIACNNAEALFSFSSVSFPTPGKRPTGKGSKNASTSSG